MLDKTVEKRLIEMMQNLAQKNFRRHLSRAVDLLCWTPLASIIRSARRAKIIEQTHQIRLHRKAAEICAEVRNNHADLLSPAWV